MSDDEERKTGEVPKRFCPDNFIKRLQGEGFVRWDPVTWIKPENIPVFIAKGKINRSRRRRGLLMAQRAEVRMQEES